jgi:hypothetical protein
MIKLDIDGCGMFAIDTGGAAATFAPEGWLVVSGPAGMPVLSDTPAHVVVEVQRRFGGLAPRAMLGTSFLPEPGGSTTRIEVGFTREPIGVAEQIPSRLWERPFRTGLPEEFVEAVLEGFAECAASLPPGRVLIDEAGYDEVESSSKIFRQTATVLKASLAAVLGANDPESAVREVVSMW